MFGMEKKYLIQQQYFDLSRYLNESNKVQNQIKEMYFYVKYINSERLLFGAISDWQKISLCKEIGLNRWVALGNTPYDLLENEFALHTHRCLKEPDLTKCLKKHIFGI